jgi:hypothetical protein
VPSQADLQARIPAGRLAVAAKTYNPPDPAFGPDSVEFLRRQTEELSFNADDHEDGETDVVSPKSNDGRDYAGKGSYF